MTGLATLPATRELRVLTYDPQQPSFRYRIAPLLPHLQALGWHCSVDVLPEQRYGWRIWRRTEALRRSTAVLLHKLRLQPWEMRWVARLNPRTVFDVDDAIWLRQPKWVGQVRPLSPARQRKFDGMCRHAALTMAGNEVLAERARRAGGRVEVVPTAVDAAGLPEPDVSRRGGRTAVWIGMPGNLQYLEPLRPVLAELASRFEGFRLRIVSSRFPDWDDVPIERVPWQPDIEHSALPDADIGLMPLADDPFTRGKCAFKLLQYMAAGLPCIASPVGANREVVVDGRTGWLAAAPSDWRAAFERLLGDAPLREAMGRAGRERALQVYDQRVVLPRAALLIEALAGADARPA